MSEELPLGDNRLDSLPNEAFAVTNEIEAGDLAFKDFNDPSTLRRYCFEILVRFMRLDYGYKVSFKTFSERLAVCSTCEHFNEEMVKCMHCECNLAEKAHECLEHCRLDLWKEDPESFEKKYYKELVQGMPIEWIMCQTPGPPVERDASDLPNKEYVSTKDGPKEVDKRTDRKLTIEEANELDGQTKADPRRNH